MEYTLLKRLSKQAMRWWYVQLTVSLYSLLILTCWGCTFCPLSFLGNLLFSPVLFIFLMLSALLFFTELLYIPNSYLLIIIEWISHYWLAAMQAGAPYSCSMACAQPTILQLITIAIGGFLILFFPTTAHKKVCALLLLIIGNFWFCSKSVPDYRLYELPCNNRGAVTIIQHEAQTTVIDTGHMGRYISAPSFVEFTLMPSIVKQLGTKTIDHLILLQPGTILFQAVNRLLEIAHVKHLYVISWEGNRKSLDRAFMQMKQTVIAKHVHLHRIGWSELTLNRSPHGHILLEPLSYQCKKADIRFNAICVHGVIDKEPFKIYSAHYMGQVQAKD